MENCKDNGKRVRDNSEGDSPESKIPRVDSYSDVNSPLARVNSGDSSLNSDKWVDSDSAALDSPGAREIQDGLLSILDETENVTERDSTMQGLDSVIKSFEEEILAPGLDVLTPTQAPESGELQSNLGYLLEASDDELGLPPTATASEEVNQENAEPGRVGPERVDLTGFLGFEDDIPNYEAFGFGAGLLVECDADNGGFVTVDGLFDYVEPSDILWRSESLQA